MLEAGPSPASTAALNVLITDHPISQILFWIGIEFLYSQGDFPRPFCFRKNSANAKTRFAVDFSGPNVLDAIAQPLQNESHDLFSRFRPSVALRSFASVQRTVQSFFGSALHARIWGGNRSSGCGESNLDWPAGSDKARSSVGPGASINRNQKTLVLYWPVSPSD